MNDIRGFPVAFGEFLATPLDSYAEAKRGEHIPPNGLFQELAKRTPAYVAFLAAQGLDLDAIYHDRGGSLIPATTKANYIHRYPLADRCLDGRLDLADAMAVSSGTSGLAVMWPRSLADESRSAFTFEAIFRRSFQANNRRTLALICFPLGIWIGGLHTISTLRLLASKGYAITTLAPGTNLTEISRCLQEIAPLFDQTVICGYPPFIKDFLSELVPTTVDPQKIRMRLVLAGEAISESWRDDMANRLAFDNPATDCISMYGTADAGAIAFETEATIMIRKQLTTSPELANLLWQTSNMPSLFQYLPGRVHIESNADAITLWVHGTHPHFKYDIGDVGSTTDEASFIKTLSDLNVEVPGKVRGELPFVHLFGRRDHTVSFFGGNVYPEHVAALLDRTQYQPYLTGRFTLLVQHTADNNRPLAIVVESRQSASISADYRGELEEALESHLVAVNSEYANYVPQTYQRPEVIVAEFHDPRFFQRGKKQSYIQQG